MSISSDVVKWAQDAKKPISTVLDTPHTAYRWRCGGDVMFHLTKGCIGLRIDGINNFLIDNVNIDTISNTAYMGNDVYNGNYYVSHSYQNRPLYHGCDSFGLSLSRVSNGKCKNVKIQNVHSENGESVGLYTYSNCHHIELKNLSIRDVSSGYKFGNGKWYGKNWEGDKIKYSNSAPNSVPMACGIHMTQKPQHFIRNKITITDISGPRQKKIVVD